MHVDTANVANITQSLENEGYVLCHLIVKVKQHMVVTFRFRHVV